jgi:ubiquinone/menaquinone biosynthesis C-methylase UbiE
MRAERIFVAFIEADAEHLPFPAATFDSVLSTFGVMFTADHEQAARELVRVCKPGGRIALASWTPEGFLGHLLRTVSRYVPPPPAAPSPLRWGNEAELAKLFGEVVVTTHVARKEFVFRYQSPQHFIDVFREFYGSTYKAFHALDAAGQAALNADLLQLLSSNDRGGGRGMVVPAEYLEIVLETRRTPHAP